MKEKRNDLYSGVVFFLFAIFLYAGSFWIPETTSDILGSRFFPRAVAVIIAVLAVVQVLSNLALAKAEKHADERNEKQERNDINRPLILTTAALFCYYVLVLQIGFTITSILYLLFEGVVLMSEEDRKNRKKQLILLLVAVIVPVFLNTIFWNVFHIALPAGALFN